MKYNLIDCSDNVIAQLSCTGIIDIHEAFDTWMLGNIGDIETNYGLDLSDDLQIGYDEDIDRLFIEANLKRIDFNYSISLEQKITRAEYKQIGFEVLNAIRLTDESKIERFLKSGDLVIIEKLLHKSIIYDRIDISKKILKTGYIISKKKLKEYFFHACQISRLNSLQFLIDLGADVNYKTKESTPLMTAMRQGYYEKVFFLLQNGANPNTSINLGEKGVISPIGEINKVMWGETAKIKRILMEYIDGIRK